LRPQEDQVAVADRREQAPVADGNAADLLRKRNLPEVLAHLLGAWLAELPRIELQDSEFAIDEAANGARDHARVDQAERLAEARPEIGGRHVVADAAPRDDRHVEDDARRRPRTRVEIGLDVAALLGEEMAPGPRVRDPAQPLLDSD